MSTVFKKLNTIDTRIKDSVFGYVRSMESKLCLDNIPALISYITLNYYYHNEYFAKFGKQVKLSNNNMTVTKFEQLKKRQYFSNTTYGNIWIDSNIPQIATWTLKMPNATFGVGMRSKDDNVDLWQGCKPYYVLDLEDSCEHDDDDNESKFQDWDDLDYLIGAEISVILDTMNRTIVFKVKKSSSIVAEYSKIQIGEKIKYKLGIHLYDIKDTVSLIDFD